MRDKQIDFAVMFKKALSHYAVIVKEFKMSGLAIIGFGLQHLLVTFEWPL
jgi:hypothetical protein